MPKFYAYLLRDPRDGKPFYVGKGKGKRMGAHFFDNDGTAKAAKIEEIKAAGRGVEYTIDSEWLVENAAYDRERELIKTLPGLTNVVHNNTKPIRWNTTQLLFRAMQASGTERTYYAAKFLRLFPRESCQSIGVEKMWDMCARLALNPMATQA